MCVFNGWKEPSKENALEPWMIVLEPKRTMPSNRPTSRTVSAMPLTFTDLPPDHPVFTIGPSFVFRGELPPEDERDDDSQSEPPDEVDD